MKTLTEQVKRFQCVSAHPHEPIAYLPISAIVSRYRELRTLGFTNRRARCRVTGEIIALEDK